MEEKEKLKHVFISDYQHNEFFPSVFTGSQVNHASLNSPTSLSRPVSDCKSRASPKLLDETECVQVYRTRRHESQSLEGIG